MRVAEVLSDLTSLRACESAAALALVTSQLPDQELDSSNEKGNADLQRAKDLIDLHYSMKAPEKKGEMERTLQEARDTVNSIAAKVR